MLSIQQDKVCLFAILDVFSFKYYVYFLLFYLIFILAQWKYTLNLSFISCCYVSEKFAWVCGWMGGWLVVESKLSVRLHVSLVRHELGTAQPQFIVAEKSFSAYFRWKLSILLSFENYTAVLHTFHNLEMWRKFWRQNYSIKDGPFML